MDEYQVTVWDKQANNPYYLLYYNDEDTAKYVARRMQLHYVDKWEDIDDESIYEVRLQRLRGGKNA